MMSENVKPTKCCGVGEYLCQIPMPLNGRIQGIDYCISDIIAALNAANITTVASCCGHNKFKGSVMLIDGRFLEVTNHVRYWETDVNHYDPALHGLLDHVSNMHPEDQHTLLDLLEKLQEKLTEIKNKGE